MKFVCCLAFLFFSGFVWFQQNSIKGKWKMAKFLVNQTDLFDNGQNKPYMEFRDTVIVTVYPDSSKKYTSYWLSHDTLYNKPNEYYIYLLKGDTLQMNRPEKAIEMTLVRVK